MKRLSFVKKINALSLKRLLALIIVMLTVVSSVGCKSEEKAENSSVQGSSNNSSQQASSEGNSSDITQESSSETSSLESSEGSNSEESVNPLDGTFTAQSTVMLLFGLGIPVPKPVML